MDKRSIIISDYNVPVRMTFDFFANMFPSDGITITISSWYKRNNDILKKKQFSNLIYLANTEEEVDFFETQLDCDVLYCNHNAFIDEYAFNIVDTPKIYDLAISSCFAKYKNTNLANKVDNTVHIGYYKGDQETIYPTYGKCINFPSNVYNKESYIRIPNKKMVSHLNSAKVGGIFSEIEGACVSSSEYLLCGLPVVSIKSKGGRDIWYNNTNSIICENNEVSVKNSVELAIKNLENGTFNRESIRQTHIEQMDIFRNRLTDFVKDKLEDMTGDYIDRPILKKYLSFRRMNC